MTILPSRLGAVDYTNCTSAEGSDKCPGYGTDYLYKNGFGVE